jgi:hypothetical protein
MYSIPPPCRGNAYTEALRAAGGRAAVCLEGAVGTFGTAVRYGVGNVVRHRARRRRAHAGADRCSGTDPAEELSGPNREKSWIGAAERCRARLVATYLLSRAATPHCRRVEVRSKFALPQLAPATAATCDARARASSGVRCTPSRCASGQRWASKHCRCAGSIESLRKQSASRPAKCFLTCW